MKRYKLTWESFDNNGSFNIFPRINASRIQNQNVLDRGASFYETFYPEDTSFKGMFLSYGTEIDVPEEPHVLCDMHSWVENSPPALVHPLSPRFRDLLYMFNIPDVRFYKGSVLWKGTEYEYYVMHILLLEQKYIDFEYSSFVKANYRGEKMLGEPIRGNNIEEVYEKLGSKLVTFERAVMLPEFRNIDMYFFNGILITERLKNAIETANLTGVKITECPIEFEFSDEV